MKLHLPVKLMRAVMAVLVSHAVVSTAWAEAVTIPEGYTPYTLSDLPAETTTGVAVLLSQNGAVNLESGITLNGNHFFASADQADLCDLTWQPGKDAVVVNGNVDFCWLDNLSFSNGEDLQSNETYLDVNSGYGNNGSLSIHNVTDVSVSGAHSVGHGAFSVSGDVAITDNTAVSFNGNAAVFSKESDTTQTLGGALCGFGNITLTNNESLEFSGNTSASKGHTANGGAIGISTGGSGEAFIKVSDNAAVIFSGNSSVANGNAACGGAITTCHTGIDVQFTGNESVVFDGNSATSTGANSAGGGALYSYDTITLSQNGSVTFSGNYVSNGVEVEGDILPDTNPIEGIPTACGGGAIFALIGDVVLKDNTGAVVFSGNYANGDFSTSSPDQVVLGGAIGTFFGGDVVLSGDSNNAENTGDTLSFTNNSVSSDVARVQGGAIYSGGDVLISDFSSVNFAHNKANTDYTVAYGGAIYSENTLEMYRNGSISFTENEIISDGHGEGAAIFSRGAVYIGSNGDVTFANNTIVSDDDGGFASIKGVAISCTGLDVAKDDDESCRKVLAIDGNNNVTFNGNVGSTAVDSHNERSVHGGAIYVGNLDDTITTINNNSSVTFADNKALTAYGEATGGAICCEGANVFLELKGNDSVTFSKNVASGNYELMGGALFVNNNLLMEANGNVLFEQNMLTHSEIEDPVDQMMGGAASSMSFDFIDNADVVFSQNSVSATYATNATGGALVAIFGYINFAGNDGIVKFDGNNVTISASSNTGADGSSITTENLDGGAIATLLGHITITDNHAVQFTGNRIQNDSEFSYIASGGAISAIGSISDTLVISNNVGGSTADGVDSHATGGAKYAVEFSENSLQGCHDSCGGAISMGKGALIADDSLVPEIKFVATFEDNGAVYFNRNTIDASGYALGGAVFTLQQLNMRGNGQGVVSGNDEQIVGVEYSANYAKSTTASDAMGGAIMAAGKIEISGSQGGVVFADNYVQSAGGNAVGGAIITFSEGLAISGTKGDVSFTANKIYGVDSYVSKGETVAPSTVMAGGAIASFYSVDIVNNEGNVSFEGNGIYATGVEGELTPGSTLLDLGVSLSGGGAIVSVSDLNITGNSSVSFVGNTVTVENKAAYGGAIAGFGMVNISDNDGDVLISNNSSISTNVVARGGAIYIGDFDTGAPMGLSIVNNSGDVTFRGNYESDQSGTVLRSVYVDQGSFNLAASNGNSITFYDSIYVGAQDNADAILNYYEDQESGVGVASTGNIIFSGKYTGNDLIAAQENLEQLEITAGAVDEASRTSVIARDVYVAAGSLQVIDGAVLRLKDDANNTSYDLLVVGKEHAAALAPHITYTDELSAKLVVSGGSMIEAGNITFGSTSQLVVREGADMSSAVFSLDEAAVQSAVLDADTIRLTGGMICDFDDAYLDLSGVNNLYLDPSNGEAITFRFGEEATIEQDGKLYFVVFSGYTELNKAIIDEDWYTHNLDNRGLQDVAMGYDADTGTLYFSATAPIPEPTTATLSLLALAGLAARRRRR